MTLHAAPASPVSLFLPDVYTVDTLPTPGPAYLDRYARVSDLFGEKRDLVLCSMVGATYFWQPVRPTYAKSISGNQSLTLTPMKMPSVLFLTGSLTGNRVLNLDNTLAWPGATFEIAMDGSLGLFSLTLAGLDLGATLSLLLNGRRRVFFDAQSLSWKQF